MKKLSIILFLIAWFSAGSGILFSQKNSDDDLDFSQVITTVPAGETAKVSTAKSSDALDEDDALLEEDPDLEIQDDVADATTSSQALAQTTYVADDTVGEQTGISSGSVFNNLKQQNSVALVSYHEVLWPTVVKVAADGVSLEEGAYNPNDPACQFTIQKDPQGLVRITADAAAGKALTAVADGSFKVQLAAPSETELSQQWMMSQDPDLQQWFGEIVRLTNKAVNANLAIPSDAMKKKSPPVKSLSLAVDGEAAGDTRESRFKILPINEIKDKVITGGTPLFHYNPRYHSWYNPTFSEQWKSPVPGTIALTFELKKAVPFTVAFTSAPVRSLGGMYYLRFGVVDDGQSAEQIVISKDVVGSSLARINFSIKQATSYWVCVDNGVITIGTGKKIGANQIGKYVDDNPLQTVCYVGLGGVSEPVDYTAITITAERLNKSSALVKEELYLPDGFTLEKSVPMKEVVSGGAEGELIAWGLGLDGSLYKWAAGSWSLHQPKLATGQKLDGIHDIALSSDGFLCCLSRGLAYEYDAQKQSWDRFRDDALQQGLSFTMISVGSKEAIWAVDSSKTTVYEYKDGSWLAQLDACIAVSVAQDGTIVALNDAGEPYMLDRSTQDGSWIDLSVMGDIMPESSLPGFKGNNQQKIQIESISVQDQAHVYAVTKDAKLVRFTVGQDGVGIWQWLVGTNSAEPFDRGIARGLIDLQVNSTGALFGVTKSGVIYKKGTQGKGARPSLSRVNQPKMKARAGQKPTGRGVTRLSRRALAQGAYADTRVRRLNRGNIKGASLKRVGRPSARRRGPVKVGKVKTQRGAPSERALVGTRTTAGTRIERVAKPRIETARKVGQTRSTPRQRSSGRVIRERSTATAGQLISTAARDARNARKLTSSTQRRAATRSTTGKLSRAERPVRSRVIAQRKPVKTQTSVPRALPPAQAGTRGIDESPSNAVMPSDEEVLSEESDIQEDTEAVFEDEGAESYDEEAFSDEEFSEGEDDMSDLADIGA